MKSAQRRPVRRSPSRRPVRRNSGYRSQRRGSYGHGPSVRSGIGRVVFGFIVVAGVLIAIVMAYDGSSGLDGDPGRVHDKDKSYIKTGKTSGIWDYDLEITRSKDGTRYWKDVSSDVYNDCVRGARYPSCGQDD